MARLFGGGGGGGAGADRAGTGATSSNAGPDNRAAHHHRRLAGPRRRLHDGKKLSVRRFDDHWLSVATGDVSYELDRQNGNLTYASATMKDGIATTIIGAGKCHTCASSSAVG
jgi:hypothetical protein